MSAIQLLVFPVPLLRGGHGLIVAFDIHHPDLFACLIHGPGHHGVTAVVFAVIKGGPLMGVYVSRGGESLPTPVALVDPIAGEVGLVLPVALFIYPNLLRRCGHVY